MIESKEDLSQMMTDARAFYAAFLPASTLLKSPIVDKFKANPVTPGWRNVLTAYEKIVTGQNKSVEALVAELSAQIVVTPETHISEAEIDEAFKG